MTPSASPAGRGIADVPARGRRTRAGSAGELTLDRCEDFTDADELHADVVASARRLVELVRARTAVDGVVEHLHVRLVDAVVLGADGTKQADRRTIERDREVHRAGVVRHDASRAA